MALTTQTDVEQRLQIDFDNDADPVIANLIADAQSHIEAYVGRALESDDYTETHDPESTIVLANWPVTALTSVTVDGTALTVNDDVIWLSDGRLFRVSNGYQRDWSTTKPQSVVVVYTGGYEVGTHTRQLNHLGSICAELVARAFRLAVDDQATPAGAGDLQSVTLTGSDTVTYATGGDVGRIPAEALSRFLSLLDSERDELGPYRDLVVA